MSSKDSMVKQEILTIGAATIYECSYDSPQLDWLLRNCKATRPHLCPSDHLHGLASLPLVPLTKTGE